MGFRKRNANKSDNRSKSKVVMGKPASQLTKEDKKILSARMAEIKSANGGKTTVQNTIPYMCMYNHGIVLRYTLFLHQVNCLSVSQCR